MHTTILTTIPTTISTTIQTNIINQNITSFITPTIPSTNNSPTISTFIPNSTNPIPQFAIPQQNGAIPLTNSEINNNNIDQSTTIEEITPRTNSIEKQSSYIKKKSGGGLKPGLIAAIVVTSVGVLSYVSIFFFCFYKGVKNQISSESAIQTLKNIEIN